MMRSSIVLTPQKRVGRITPMRASRRGIACMNEAGIIVADSRFEAADGDHQNVSGWAEGICQRDKEMPARGIIHGSGGEHNWRIASERTQPKGAPRERPTPLRPAFRKP